MRNKTLFWIIAFIVMMFGTAYAASALDYFTYRMNFPPGTSKYHEQQINFSGNLTITLPLGFSFTNSSMSYATSGSNYTWQSSNLTTVRYTIQSPGSGNAGAIYKSKIYNDGVFIDEFIYVSIEDEKVVDYKVEYGHGCGNYLAQNEPFISNESATIFNLVRVWNIGSYLDPDEDAENAHIKCFYGDYPVRTYGRVDVRYGASSINGSFSWDNIYGGYWFRIGVMSQEVSGKSIGDIYSVNCTELEYDFSHERIVASFPNYTLEVRATEPLAKNITLLGTKEIVTIKNIEKYPVYNLILNFIIDGFVETNRLARLGPGETVTFFADAGTNTTISFVPSWQRHCFTPVYYTQILTNATNISINNPPSAKNIPSFAWVINTSNDNAFDLDDYFSDAENDSLTFGYSGTVNITVTINSSTNEVSFSQPSNFTGIEYLIFSANDGQSTTYSNNITLIVYPADIITNVTEVTQIIQRGGGKKTVYVYVPVNVTVNVSEEPECIELWLCTEWSECYSEGYMNRTCQDLNKCGISLFGPKTKESCVPEDAAQPYEEITAPAEEKPEEKICGLCITIPFGLMLLFILLVILIFEERKKENEVSKWKKKTEKS